MLKLSDKNVSKKMYENYLKYLLEKYFNINNNIIDNNSFLNFSCFYPLPNSLETSCYKEDNEILCVNNIYQFTGSCLTNRILFGNRLLPNPNTDPIPFTFPIITDNNTIELINTNCFYYEITICERTREPWISETISIGFGSITTPIKCNPGWITDTIGYYLNDGSIQCNQLIFKNCGPICNINDTIGAGIIYISPNNYNIFFTFNGSIIENDYSNNIIIKSQITPIIGYNHSCKIKINFGNDVFKFNIKKYCNTNIIISQNNQFINDYEFINKINTKNIIENKYKNLYKPYNNLSSLFAISDDNSKNNLFKNLILDIITQNNL